MVHIPDGKKHCDQGELGYTHLHEVVVSLVLFVCIVALPVCCGQVVDVGEHCLACLGDHFLVARKSLLEESVKVGAYL